MITINSVPQPRQGWGEAFMQMNANKYDQLLMDDVFEDENPEEWE